MYGFRDTGHGKGNGCGKRGTGKCRPASMVNGYRDTGRNVRGGGYGWKGIGGNRGGVVRSHMKHRAEKDTYLRIWRTVERIPRGKVASYGTIAMLSGFPRQGRLAGYALHNLPGGTGIPWHRVINAKGKISIPGKRGEEQERLLREEGIAFTRGIIDMGKCEWRSGPGLRKKR